MKESNDFATASVAAKLKEEIAREKRIPEGCRLDKLRGDDKPKCGEYH